MRVAFYTPSVASINVGGVETFVREIALRIAGRGHEVSILSGLGVLSRESHELISSGVQFALFPFIRRYTKLSHAALSLSSSLIHSKLTPYAIESLSMLPFGLSYLATHKYDVVPIVGMSDSLARIAIKHGSIIHYQGGLIVDWQIRFLRKFPPECIIACSQFTVEQLRIRRIACPIYSIPNGVNVNRFYPDSTIRQKMRNELQVSDKNVILFVGRFVEEKGVEDLIRSMSFLEHGKAVLMLIGSGPLQFKYEALATKYMVEMKILGPIPNILLPAYYNMADIFVLPSLLEPAAMVLSEAQACGVPVISTNTGGTPERVKDRITGLLVPPSAPEKLAHAINMLLNNIDMRDRMGKEARKYILANFNWDDIVMKILQIYQTIQRDT